MSELRELYQEVILDHGRRPRNFRALGDPTHSAEGYNPLCGDRVKLFLRCNGGRVVEASFQGSGCAISTASASLLTEALVGKTPEEAEKAFALFHRLVTGGELNAEENKSLGKLAVFSGVCEFPTRVKCATLAWHTLDAALRKTGDQPVSTE